MILKKMIYFWIITIFQYIVAEGKFCGNNVICDEDELCCGTSDAKWCCPKGTRCYDEVEGFCLKIKSKTNFTSLSKSFYHSKVPQGLLKSMKTPESKARKNMVPVIPSTIAQFKKCDEAGLYYCADEETCCKVQEGWACCRYTNGTCCKDGKRCCPADTTCLPPPSATGCSDEKFNFPTTKSFTLLGDSIRKDNVKAVIFCPGRRQVCSDTNTCCLIGNDTYGCCPYQDAVCCSDLTHCCPPNTSCDVKEMKCFPNDDSYKKNILPLKFIRFFKKNIKQNPSEISDKEF